MSLETSRFFYFVMVYFCYIDESGVPQIPGNTSHYVLAGLSIPIHKWKYCDRQIQRIKAKYDLQQAEVHTAWIARTYIEQDKIDGFDELTREERRREVEKYRLKELLKLQKSPNQKHYRQTKKNYKKSEAYTHLTRDERIDLLRELAESIGSWTFARIFAECIDKVHFDPSRASRSVDEQAFEQVVSRFEQYLQIRSKSTSNSHLYGALIHDNNDTVSQKHTELMQRFHSHGTLWTRINRIIETPLFVNSELTGMVQIADLCSYSIRRYLENGEDDFLNRVMPRVDKKNGKIVGARHFTDGSCACIFCH
ncbi:MAG: DUF3800 domain-containing protein [Flavobacteriales bacterium]|nr:DUF3800 domain-containing protein [Flavobacteriales bacterium]